MGKVSDYISSLENKTDIDPIVIASTLLELHNEEMGIAEGKIAKVETDLEASNKIIAETNDTVKDLKAKNWDLVNRIPADNANDRKPKSDDQEKDASEITFDDFFEKED